MRFSVVVCVSDFISGVGEGVLSIFVSEIVSGVGATVGVGVGSGLLSIFVSATFSTLSGSPSGTFSGIGFEFISEAGFASGVGVV